MECRKAAFVADALPCKTLPYFFQRRFSRVFAARFRIFGSQFLCKLPRAELYREATVRAHRSYKYCMWGHLTDYFLPSVLPWKVTGDLCRLLFRGLCRSAMLWDAVWVRIRVGKSNSSLGFASSCNDRNTCSSEFSDQLSTLLFTAGVLAHTSRTHVWPLPLPNAQGELTRMAQQKQNVEFASL